MGRRRTTPPKKPGKTTKWTSLSKLLWEIEQEYNEMARRLKEEKTQKMREVVLALCPLPEPKEVLVANHTWRDQKFQYEDFRVQCGDVILYGPTYLKDGKLSTERKGESRVDGDLITFEMPCGDK